jgi:Flp pilus assembly protein TadD
MPTPTPATQTPCPDESALRKFLRDELPAEEAGRIDRHLGACPACQRLLDRLIGALPPGLIATTGASGAVEEDGPPVLPGCETLGPVAAGGMGVVWRVRDLEFGRDLAVKVLKLSDSGDARAAERFLAEARITGRLAHPVIVPVHGMGRLPDGRPWYTMKLVQGQTLAELLKDRPDLAEGRMELLRVFSQVCQAVAFAHGQGVIHRDLKPHNVMVGAHGEVQVMDWGLAKVLERVDPPPAEEKGADGASAETRDDRPHTRTGSILGTSAYMPPEQARGLVDQVDRRADVFGLGAILCEILTGRPPYTGSREDVPAQARAGNLTAAWARLDGCGADVELVHLATACLAADREARPADARAVAAAVAAYQAGVEERLRRAELERAAAEAEAREQRRRRRVQLALAAAVGLLALGVGAFAWWQHEQGQAAREQRGRNAVAVAGLLDQGEEALKVGDSARAATALEAAEKRAVEGGADDLAARMERYRADLTMLRALNAIDQFRWTVVKNRYPYPQEVAGKLREAFSHFGLALQPAAAEKDARRVAASAVRDRLVAALDLLLWVDEEVEVRLAQRHQISMISFQGFDELVEHMSIHWTEVKVTVKRAPESAVLEILQVVDPDEYRNQVRGAIWNGRDVHRLLRLLMKPEALDQPPGFAAVLGMLSWVLPPVERRQGIEKPAPGEPTQAVQMPIAVEQDREFQRREQRRREILKVALTRRPNDLGLLMTLGGSGRPFSQALKPPEAVRWFQAAVAAHPQNAAAHHHLAHTLWQERDLAGAEAEYRAAIHLNPKDAQTHLNLGRVLREQEKLDGAVKAFREAVRLDPTDVGAVHDLAMALREQGKPDEVAAAFQAAVAYHPQDYIIHHELGWALSEVGDLSEAVKAFKKAIELSPKAHVTCYVLGCALRNQGKLDEAVEAFQQAIDLGLKSPRVAEALWQTRRWRELLPRLDAIATGKVKPASPEEGCDLACLCSRPFVRQYTLAVRLSEQAFAAKPPLTAEHQYDAACFAARAAADDKSTLSPKDRADLRAKALTWLRDELVLLKEKAASAKAADRAEAAQKLSHALRDVDLASTRGGKGRNAWSNAERDEWGRFWAEVHSTLAVARQPAR